MVFRDFRGFGTPPNGKFSPNMFVKVPKTNDPGTLCSNLFLGGTIHKLPIQIFFRNFPLSNFFGGFNFGPPKKWSWSSVPLGHDHARRGKHWHPPEGCEYIETPRIMKGWGPYQVGPKTSYVRRVPVSEITPFISGPYLSSAIYRLWNFGICFSRCLFSGFTWKL